MVQNQPTDLACDITGSPVPVITWYKDGILVSKINLHKLNDLFIFYNRYLHSFSRFFLSVSPVSFMGILSVDWRSGDFLEVVLSVGFEHAQEAHNGSVIQRFRSYLQK